MTIVFYTLEQDMGKIAPMVFEDAYFYTNGFGKVPFDHFIMVIQNQENMLPMKELEYIIHGSEKPERILSIKQLAEKYGWL